MVALRKRIPSLAGCRILVVEDDYFIAFEMVQSFETKGAIVVGPISNVEEALHLVRSGEALDAAVLDINIQGKAAYPVADALIARRIPFVFATGYDRRTVPAAYDGIVTCGKPIEPEGIAAALFG